MIYLVFKTSYLNGEVTCTEPSPSVSIPLPKVLIQNKVNQEKMLNKKIVLKYSISDLNFNYWIYIASLNTLTSTHVAQGTKATAALVP